MLHSNTAQNLQLTANELITVCVWMRYPSITSGGGSLYSLFKKENCVYTNCCNDKALLEEVFDKTVADGDCFSSRALIG